MAITTGMFFVLAFLIMFVIGGLSGLVLSNTGLDLVLHDSYYVIGRRHRIVSKAFADNVSYHSS